MIHKRSRYKETPIAELDGSGGDKVRLLELRAPGHPGGFFYATPGPGERLDHLAHRYYRDPTRFWRICDGATELDPFDVVWPGVPLLIPPND